MKRQNSPLLCLEIDQARVTAALFAGASRQPPLAVAEARRAERSLGECLAELRERLATAHGLPCRVSLGADWFSFRSVDLPFSDPKKISQVLAMELAERVAVEIDSLQLDFIANTVSPAGATVLAAMIDRKLLAEVTAALAEVGWTAQSIGVAGFDLATALAAAGHSDLLLLDGAGKRSTLFLVQSGKVVGLRSLAEPLAEHAATAAWLPGAVRQTVLAAGFRALCSAEIPFFCNATGPLPAAVAPWTARSCPLAMSADGSAGLLAEDRLRRLVAMVRRDPREKGRLEFCKGEFAPKASRWSAGRSTRPAFIALIAVFFVASLAFAYDYIGLMKERDQLRQQIAETFRETAPADSRLVDPVRQLQVMIKERQGVGAPRDGNGGGPSVIDLLSEISLRIPVQMEVRLTRFSVEAGVVLLKGVTGDFNTVERVRSGLEQSPLFREVTIGSANQEERGERITFELRLLAER